MRDLHKRLFGDVWKWAGSFRAADGHYFTALLEFVGV